MQEAPQLKERLQLIQDKIKEFKKVYEICLEEKSQVRAYFDRKFASIDRCMQKMNLLLQQTCNNSVISKFLDLKASILKLIKHIENGKADLNKIEYSDKRIFIEHLAMLGRYSTLTQPLSGKKLPNEKEHLQALSVRVQQLKLNLQSEFKELLHNLDCLRGQTKAKISCFLSYAWPSEDRAYECWTQDFIKLFSDHIRLAGIETYLDIDNSRFGYNSYEHMNKISDCHFVILFGTESLFDKHNLGISSVCVELNRIRQRRFSDARTHQYNVIPIVLSGNMSTALPGEYERYTVVESFVGKSYLVTLQGLLRRLYLFGNEHREYNDIWEKAMRAFLTHSDLPAESEVRIFWQKLQEEMAKKTLSASNSSVQSLETLQPASSTGIPTAALPILQPAIKPIVGLPFNRNVYFTGRDEVFSQIKHQLITNPVSAIVQSVSGLGGVGKTQLVVEYAYRGINNGDYRLVWFLSANNITFDLLRLADVLGIPPSNKDDERINLVIQKLNQIDKWLLIYDNVKEYEKIKHLFPRCGGHILLTSRDRRIIKESIAIGVFSRVEAVNFIIHYLRRSDEATHREAELLAHTLGDFPLALAQACAYIDQQKISITKYIQYFEERRKQLWQKEKPPQDYHSTVAVTWSISIEKIRAESESAYYLLYYMAYLSPSNIPQYLLIRFIKDQDEFEFEDARGILHRYNMITLSENHNYISIHKLIQTVLRDHLSEIKLDKAYLSTVLIEIKKIFPKFHFVLNLLATLASQERKPLETHHDTVNQCRELKPHLESALIHVKEDIAAFPNIPSCYTNLGMACYVIGSTLESMLYLEDALRLKEKSTRKEEADLEVAEIHHCLFLPYRDFSNDTQACWHLEAALEIVQRIPADNDKRYLNLLLTLGIALSGAGFSELRKGLSYLIRALPIAHKVYGEIHHLTLFLTYQIAMAYDRLGQIPVAKDYFQRQLFIARQLGIPINRPPNRGVEAEENAPSLFALRKKIEEIEQQLQASRSLHSTNNPITIMLLQGLGTTHMRLGNYNKALEVFKEAKQIVHGTFGREHRAYHVILCNLGELWHTLDNSEAALQAFSEASSIIISTDGPNHPRIGEIYYAIGTIHFDNEDYEQSLSELKKALKIFSMGIDEHPFISEMLYTIGECHFNLDEYEDALENYQRALTIYRRLFISTKFPPVTHLLFAIGDCHKELGSHQRALDLFQQVIPLVENQQDPEIIVQLYFKMAENYYGLHQPDLALEYYQKSMSFNPDKSLIYHNAACCFHLLAITQSKPAYLLQAENCFLKAIQIIRSADVCVEYANYLYQTSRFDEALTYLIEIIDADGNGENSVLHYTRQEALELPEELRSEFSASREMLTFDTVCFACYLTILIYMKKNRNSEARTILDSFELIMLDNDDPCDTILLNYSRTRLGMSPSVIDENPDEDDDDLLLQQAMALSLEQAVNAPPHIAFFPPTPKLMPKAPPKQDTGSSPSPTSRGGS